ERLGPIERLLGLAQAVLVGVGLGQDSRRLGALRVQLRRSPCDDDRAIGVAAPVERQRLNGLSLDTTWLEVDRPLSALEGLVGLVLVQQRPRRAGQRRYKLRLDPKRFLVGVDSLGPASLRQQAIAPLEVSFGRLCGWHRR